MTAHMTSSTKGKRKTAMKVPMTRGCGRDVGSAYRRRLRTASGSSTIPSTAAISASAALPISTG